MKHFLVRFLFIFKKKSFVMFIFLIMILLALLFYSKPLSLELKVNPKLKKQAEFSKKSNQVLSYLKTYQNQFLWQIDLKQLVQDIEKMSLGLDVYVQRKYPQRLIVELDEKEIALLLLKGDSHFYAVSYDGKLGPQKTNQNIVNVPILRGAEFENQDKLRKQVLQLLKPIPEKGFLFSTENISEILYNKTHKSFLIYLSNKSLVLKLNTAPSLQKIKNIEFVLKYLEKEERHSSLIDARPDKKIIVKKNL